MVNRGSLQNLLQDVDALIELEHQCGTYPHASIDDIPVDWIWATSAEELLDAGQVQLSVWHRDLCWHLAPVDDLDRPNCASALQACQRLAGVLDEVPRDTVYTYAARAFAGAPATFSHMIQETHFVLGLRDASRALLLLTRHALAMHTHSVAPIDPTESLAVRLADGIPELRAIIARVIKTVDVLTFVHHIEPNFKRKMIAGKMYYGPTAAQLPLVSLEALLYGATAADTLCRHVMFQRAYMPRALRAVVDYGISAPPLLFEHISRELSHRILKDIERFRRIHLAIARKAFALQSHPSQKAREILETLLEHHRGVSEPTPVTSDNR